MRRARPKLLPPKLPAPRLVFFVFVSLKHPVKQLVSKPIASKSETISRQWDVEKGATSTSSKPFFRGFPFLCVSSPEKNSTTRHRIARTAPRSASLRNRNNKCTEMAAVLGQTAFLGVAPRVAAKVRLGAAEEGLSPRVGK